MPIITKIYFITFIAMMMLTSFTNSMSSRDLNTFSNTYRQKTGRNSRWDPNLLEDIYSPEDFGNLFATSLFQRIQKFEKFLGAGSGGFTFLATYTLPDGSKSFPACIKIMKDSKRFGAFYDNVVLARLTGNYDEDKYRPGIFKNYSYDEPDNRVEANMAGTPNQFSSFINKFYEMQHTTLTRKGQTKEDSRPFYVTTLVTEVGTQDMASPLFSDTPTKKKANTATFIRYFKELVQGAINMHSQHILHGDIKEPNVILETGEDNKQHVSYIDLDLMLEVTEEKDLTTDQERYTPGYKAPWIKHPAFTKVEIEKRTDKYGKPTQKEHQIPYWVMDRDYKEDLYAVALTWTILLRKNLKELDENDKTLIAVNQLVRKALNEQRKQFPNGKQFLDALEIIIANAEQIKEEQKNKIVTDQQPPVQVQNNVNAGNEKRML